MTSKILIIIIFLNFPPITSDNEAVEQEGSTYPMKDQIFQFENNNNADVYMPNQVTRSRT